MEWSLYALSLLGLCVCAAELYCVKQASHLLGGDAREVVLFLLAVSAIAATCEFLTLTLSRFRIALAFRTAAFLLALSLVTGIRSMEIILLCGLILEIAVYEDYPQNIFFGSGAVLLSMVVRQAVFMANQGLSLRAALFNHVDFIFPGLFLVVSTGLASRHREELIVLSREMKRLDETAVKLTRLNLQYQDFATSATETAMESERKRITRDIFDVVGHALTNNIVMMDAVTDTMRRNSFDVPAFINKAKENALEDLDRIRDALYRMRESGVQVPRGLRAVSRMCRIFEKATGIRVRFEPGNAAWTYGDVVDSALYHLVQESLIISFRHGRAGTITVHFTEQEGHLIASVGDDGMGSPAVQEGMGLHSIREKFEDLGGNASFDGTGSGFSVSARIPLAGKS